MARLGKTDTGKNLLKFSLGRQEEINPFLVRVTSSVKLGDAAQLLGTKVRKKLRLGIRRILRQY